MNILDADTLAIRLRDESVSEREKLNYLFLLMAMALFTGSPNLITILRQPFWLLIYGAVLAVGVIGIIVCYETNRRGDNRAFVERLVILAAPVSVRVIGILYIALMVLTRTGVLRNFRYTTNMMVWGACQVVVFSLGVLWLRGAIALASSGPIRTSAIVTVHGD